MLSRTTPYWKKFADRWAMVRLYEDEPDYFIFPKGNQFEYHSKVFPTLQKAKDAGNADLMKWRTDRDNGNC